MKIGHAPNGLSAIMLLNRHSFDVVIVPPYETFTRWQLYMSKEPEVQREVKAKSGIKTIVVRDGCAILEVEGEMSIEKLAGMLVTEVNDIYIG